MTGPGQTNPDKLNIWEGDRVRLRSIRGDDWQVFHRSQEDTEAMRRGDIIPFPRSPESTRRWAENRAMSSTGDDNQYLAIENLDGELVGTINSHHCDHRHGAFSLGIGIFREHWRRGYASDAIRVLLRYFFRELRYQKANADVFDFNSPSIKLFERLGFQREGQRRRMLFTDGDYHDVVLFGITREEFVSLDGQT